MSTQNKTFSIGLLGCYLITLTLILFMPNQSFAAKVIGNVMVSTGLVQGQLPNQAKRALKRRSSIYENDTLTTSAKGYAQIRFLDRTLVTLKPNTVYRIDEYSYQESGKANAHKATLLGGGARTLTGEIKKSKPKDVTIKTKMAIVGLRGTEVSTDYVEKGIEIRISDGVAEITNQAGTFLIGRGQKDSNVLVASQTSKPISLAVSEALTAFNVVNIEAQYEALTSINEALTQAQLDVIAPSIQAFVFDFGAGAPSDEFIQALEDNILKSLIKDSYTTANLAESAEIIEESRLIAVVDAQSTAQDPPVGCCDIPSNDFPRFFSQANVTFPGVNLFAGRSTDNTEGHPIQYDQSAARETVSTEPLNIFFAPTSYIDDPQAPEIGLTYQAFSTLTLNEPITNISADPIRSGLWENVTNGPTVTLQLGPRDNKFIFGFRNEFSKIWIDFVASSLTSLRAIKGQRNYTNVVLGAGFAYNGQPIPNNFRCCEFRLDEVDPDDGSNTIPITPSPITNLISNFSLDFGTNGVALGLSGGSMDFTTEDSDGNEAIWHFELGDNIGIQAGNNIFITNETRLSGTLTSEDITDIDGPISAEFLGNVFSAHSRIYGPHAPGAGFAGTFMGIRAEPTPEGIPPRVPNEGIITGTFVLTTD